MMVIDEASVGKLLFQENFLNTAVGVNRSTHSLWPQDVTSTVGS